MPCPSPQHCRRNGLTPCSRELALTGLSVDRGVRALLLQVPMGQGASALPPGPCRGMMQGQEVTSLSGVDEAIAACREPQPCASHLVLQQAEFPGEEQPPSRPGRCHPLVLCPRLACHPAGHPHLALGSPLGRSHCPLGLTPSSRRPVFLLLSVWLLLVWETHPLLPRWPPLAHPRL